MFSRILRRVGLILLAVSVVDGAVTIAWLDASRPYPAALGGIAAIGGIALLWGGPRAALWVRTFAVFTLAATLVLLAVAPLFQPLDLTLAEMRHGPADFAAIAVTLAVTLCVTLWVTLRLGHASVRDTIANGGIWRWDMRLPALAGGGLVAVVISLLWLALHGQSADLATSLALQQLGPDYR